MVRIVIGKVVDVWFGDQQLGALSEVNVDYEGVGFGRFVDGAAGEKFTTDLQRRSAVAGADFHTGQGEGDFPDEVEGDGLGWHFILEFSKIGAAVQRVFLGDGRGSFQWPDFSFQPVAPEAKWCGKVSVLGSNGSGRGTGNHGGTESAESAEKGFR
jgi:hypothetical protein